MPIGAQACRAPFRPAQEEKVFREDMDMDEDSLEESGAPLRSTRTDVEADAAASNPNPSPSPDPDPNPDPTPTPNP